MMKHLIIKRKEKLKETFLYKYYQGLVRPIH